MVTPAERFAISSLLLPVHGRAGDAYFERAKEKLTAVCEGEELTQWVRAQLDLWRSEKKPSRALKEVIQTVLYDNEADPTSYVTRLNPGERGTARSEACKNLADGYFRCVEALMTLDGLTVDEARGVASQSGVVIAATVGEQQSAARIWHNLRTSGVSIGKSFRVPQALMNMIGHLADLSVEETQNIYEADVLAEPDLLADLSPVEAVEYVGEIARDLGATTSILEPFRTLMSSEQRHDPYLVMLHFQLTTAVKYDSLLVDLYEFSPRSVGGPAEWITEKYNNAGLEARSNPYLNNAKSVELLTESWANNKKRLRFAAWALVELLEMLDGLAPLQRQTLGALIRSVLHRIIRISSTDPATMLRVPVLNAEHVRAISEYVAPENTATLGIVEQRYVDAVTLAEKREEGVWRTPRGLGDSVNASNLSRKKFGDIEFKHNTDSRIVAYEAHGGVLTKGYVQDHLSSLPYVLDFRRAELEDRAAIEDWRLEVIFVAHQFRGELPEEENVGGLPATISYILYANFAPEEANEALVETFNEVFVPRINAIQTPHRVRQSVHDVVAAVD